MATSCCAATSTRLVASSSCRARKTSRTLAMKHPPLAASPLKTWVESASSYVLSSSSSPSLCSSRSASLRRMSSSSLARTTATHRVVRLDPCTWTRSTSSASATSASATSASTTSTSTTTSARWLEHLRRQTVGDNHNDNSSNSSQKQQLSAAIMAFALCMLASTAATTTAASASTTPTMKSSSSTNLDAGNGVSASASAGAGGLSPHTNAPKPTFMFSRLKAEQEVQKVQEEAAQNPYLVSEGVFQGARWTMEDMYTVQNGGRFVAVFDGHGGAEVSTLLQHRLYDLYSEELAKKHWEKQNEFGVKRKVVPSKSSHIAALQRGLEQVEEAVIKLDELVYQGSTAVCVVLHVANDGKRTLLTANIGDSRAILCRGDKAVDLTRDHKPSDEREMERIRAMGEEVEWDPYGQVYRVRDLSLSRAVGDRFAKPVVTSEPEITTFPVMEDEDEFVVLASDGLWDVMSSQDVVDYVHEIMETEIEALSQLDKRKNMGKIVANEALERGTADNVCVLVLWLKKEA